MPTLLDPSVAHEISARIDRLRPDSLALWGKMNANQMVCHLTDAFKVALGDTPTTLRPGPLSSKLARWLIISVLPVPRARARTMREFKLTAPQVWAKDVQTLKGHMERFIARAWEPNPQWNVHPAFGQLSTTEYGKLVAKHMDHHLRQFGV